MKKSSVLSLLVAFILLCLTNYVLANPSRFEGKPDQATAELYTGYFVWQDKDGFHVWAGSSEQEHVFTGVIHTDGFFDNVFMNIVGKNDYTKVERKRQYLRFQMTTSGKVSGIDFNISNGTFAKLELLMDGENTSASNIYIGKEGWHPESHKFILFQGCYKVGKSDGRKAVILDDSFLWHPGSPHFPHFGTGPHAPYW